MALASMHGGAADYWDQMFPTPPSDSFGRLVALPLGVLGPPKQRNKAVASILREQDVALI